MRQLLTIFSLITLFTFCLKAQPMMQASLGAGSNSNRVKVYIKPDAPVNGTISTLQFDIALEESVSPVPTLTMIGTPSFGLTWFIDPTYLESGYRHYQITTAISPTINIPANLDTLVFEVEFSGGPSGTFPIYLITLPEGGYVNGNALFLCTGAAYSVSGQLYYPRTGVTVVNNDSYNPGGGISYAVINGITLPVELTDFKAFKDKSDGILYWNMERNSKLDYFEIERSNDEVKFQKIAKIESSNAAFFSYRDANIDALKTNNVYYRLKIIEKDGNTSYSEIRVLKTDYKQILIKIFPNPTQDFLTVQSSDLNNISDVYLQNSLGQTIHVFSFENNDGWSKTLPLNDLNLVSGNYYLIIYDKNRKKYTEKFNFIESN